MSIDGTGDRTPINTAYLELSDGQSHKFYEITVNGADVTIRYGRINTSGQSSSTTYATPEKAQAEATKKINEKLRKGYVQTATEEDISTPSNPLPNPLEAVGASGVSSRTINPATLPAQVYQGRQVIAVSLQQALVAIDIIAICKSPTFTINLDVAADIAYHFDVRAAQGQIVQNTCVAGRWGIEERVPIPADLTADQPFTLKIAVEDALVIALNNRVLSRYAHRLPPAQINTIHVVYPPGDLQVQSLQVFERLHPKISVPGSVDPQADNPELTPESDPPAPQPEPLPVPAPIHVNPPSSELLNQATSSQSGPPRVAKEHLRQVSYPLGFTLREMRYSSLDIPLPRSLVCFEMLGTFNDLSRSSFTISLCAQQDIAYRFSFRPQEGAIVQDIYAVGVKGSEERLAIPNGLASGQLFQLVVAITAKRDIVFYLNNHPFYYTPPYRPAEPLDKLVLNYDTSGFHLQMLRVFEPKGADRRVGSSPPPRSQAELTPRPSHLTSPVAIAPTPAVDIPGFLQELPPQFEPLRSFLEAHLEPYIRFTATEVDQLNASDDPLESWQSKIGGYPYLPKGTSYPSDSRTGQLMMFLMQINCADLPIINSLNLPRQGLLQFYVGLDVAMCELSPEQHRVLYFPEISQDKNDLVTDFSFLLEAASALEWYENIYALTFSLHQDVFWNARQELDKSFEIPIGLEKLCEEFDEWISDYEDQCSLQRKHGRVNKLGGYPELHSEVGETVGGTRGRLLLELQHDFNCDDNFYFFIEDLDLANAYFSNIESYFLRN